MNRPQAVAAATAGAGVLVVVVGGVATAGNPDVHDMVRAAGLLLMLLGAGIFLAAQYVRRTASRATWRLALPPAAQETARNLMVVGGVFVVGALAVGVGFRWMLTPRMWGYWILAGLAILGAAALAGGAVGLAMSVLCGGGRPNGREQNSL